MLNNKIKYMKRIIFISVLLVMLVNLSAFSQSTVTLLNGKTKPFLRNYIDPAAGMFYYKIQKPSGKEKTKSVLLEDVFSYIDSSNIEHIIYEPMSPEELSVMQMRSYIKGSAFAHSHHEPYWFLAGGFAVGAGSMFITHNPMYNPILPVAYCGGIALVKPSTDKLILDHPEYAENPDLLYGYRRTAKHKNVKYAIIGSLGGMLIGGSIALLTGYY